MQDLPQLALTILTVDFLRYALAAGAIWLLVSVIFGRRLVGRRILDAAPQPGQVRREFTYSLSTVVHAAVIAVFLVHMILRNAIGHCAHELLPWRWTPRGWLGWITPVSHHHFHHARNRGNFGLYFTWWDRWCGTEDAEYLRHGDARFSSTARPGIAS